VEVEAEVVCVEELCLLLQNVTLQVDTEERWLWRLDKSNVYSVRSAYNLLTSQPLVAASLDVKSLWHMDILLKVVVFAWRLFRNRLPTKDNLFRRGAINHDFCLCVTGCGSLKTTNHLFFSLLIFWFGLELHSSMGCSFYGSTVRCFRSFQPIRVWWWWYAGDIVFVECHLVCYCVGNMKGKK